MTLSRRPLVLQEERSAQLAARYAALADMEGGHIDMDAASEDDMDDDGDTGPAVITGEAAVETRWELTGGWNGQTLRMVVSKWWQMSFATLMKVANRGLSL